MVQPKVTLRYIDPRVDGKYQEMDLVIAKLMRNEVLAMIPWRNKTSIDISLVELSPGGLEHAVGECVELFIPLSGVRSYNAEGLRITKGALEQLGYKLKKKSFFAGLFNPYLPVVDISARAQEIVNST